jgi:citrate synthase
MEPMPDQWIEAAQAAERLGVKPATLYAYVSRGVLRRRHAPDGRRSLFNTAEIEELARRGRPRRPPGPAELQIESALTALGKDRPYYRGRDALELAGSMTYEQVAGWLWSGDTTGPWSARPEGVAAAVAAQSGLPDGVLPIDRLQIIVAALAASDPMRFQLDPPAVIATARTLIASMVEALPLAGDPGGGPARGDASPAGGLPDGGASRTGGGVLPGGIAGRLWGRLCAQPVADGLDGVVEAAMVVLADHELAASTLAARVAASVRADPYAIVTAGLGVLSGPRHGGASLGAERLLTEIEEPGQVQRVIGERLRRGERIPGAGHQVYKSGDGRMGLLFGLLREAVPGHERLVVAEAVLAELRTRRLPEPNVDFALATLTSVAGMIHGAGEAIFAVARTAGWLAHGLEEYAGRSPLRPRAVYTGPPITH